MMPNVPPVGGGVAIVDVAQQNPECCIHKVPQNLRNVNEEAYIPQLISIGPYHYGKEKLANMEKLKIRYKAAFDGRITPNKRESLQNFIKNNKNLVRRHYAEDTSEFRSAMFVEMILVDSIFIIELFLRYYLMENGANNLLNEVWLAGIRQDLQLLENQLPYFVLEELHRLASPFATPNGNLFPNFRNLSCHFFLLHLPPNRPPYDQAIQVKHFTDLCRHALVPNQPMGGAGQATMKPLPNAVKLVTFGVNLNSLSDEYLLKMRLIRRINSFNLGIPSIYVNANTESLIRNLMALEQFCYPSETYICSYVELMGFLVKTVKDVDFLVEREVIYNFTGDNAAVADMFNKLCLQIPHNNSHYHDIYERLTAHCNNPWNRAVSIMRVVVFGDLGKAIGILTAYLGFIGTLINIELSVIRQSRQ